MPAGNFLGEAENLDKPEDGFSAYTACGFSPELDAQIAKTRVAEPDRSQTFGMVRVCDATAAAIYEGGFSPRRIQYREGSRPRLERAAPGVPSHPGPETACAVMHWVHHHVRHAWTSEAEVSTTRGLTEEQILSSGIGWCNEQARVFIALCGIRGIAARLCFVFHASLPLGHAAAEAFVDGRWGFFDPTFDLHVALPGNRIAEARELGGPLRPLAHGAYRSAYDRFLPEIANSWRPHFLRTHDADPARPGDLLAFQGITNYVIDGVQALDGGFHLPSVPHCR
ncbi:MAG TPA: transglutaminase domain-containing protein [Terrimicrobiaceae bacterium]|nr:transglutaminase domain-containing protein [Terrimicrobiaceae bacterium]